MAREEEADAGGIYRGVAICTPTDNFPGRYNAVRASTEFHSRAGAATRSATICCQFQHHLTHLCAGHYTPSSIPHFLWVTEFPLFTRADNDKQFLTQGRWGSTHHPFTAPMSRDMEAFWNGRTAEVTGIRVLSEIVRV